MKNNCVAGKFTEILNLITPPLRKTLRFSGAADEPRANTMLVMKALRQWGLVGRVCAAPGRRDFSLPVPITHSGVSPMPHLPQNKESFGSKASHEENVHFHFQGVSVFSSA
ncbi:hypothetical protein BME96_14355 [Virgibacillus halodenitrificans]|uniref:Uncharacterized protein n=1 Tax=Virgibacillus halodenitrificans TaxID=1482 RepID=A0AAC9J2G1_VIRHA|nr:hypothetical protein BME96_14355 [Virgibacillus halodenitrificans]